MGLLAEIPGAGFYSMWLAATERGQQAKLGRRPATRATLSLPPIQGTPNQRASTAPALARSPALPSLRSPLPHSPFITHASTIASPLPATLPPPLWQSTFKTHAHVLAVHKKAVRTL